MHSKTSLDTSLPVIRQKAQQLNVSEVITKHDLSDASPNSDGVKIDYTTTMVFDDSLKQNITLLNKRPSNNHVSKAAIERRSLSVNRSGYGSPKLMMSGSESESHKLAKRFAELQARINEMSQSSMEQYEKKAFTKVRVKKVKGRS